MVKVLLVAYNLFFFLLFTDSTASVTTGLFWKRLAGVENIVFCCNRSTADHIISSPLFMDPDYERIHPDYSSYTKRFQNKPVVTEAVESVNRRKKKRK